MDTRSEEIDRAADLLAEAIISTVTHNCATVYNVPDVGIRT